MRFPSRLIVSLGLVSTLAACAPYKSEDAEADTYDRRTTTGSNIPKKGGAVVVDKSVVSDQQMRQGGTVFR